MTFEKYGTFVTQSSVGLSGISLRDENQVASEAEWMGKRAQHNSSLASVRFVGYFGRDD